MELKGIHHLTAITARASDNLAFYTGVLGLRLVKKTVNQDDVSAYHLFYADGKASPGTDITFFDWPVGPERRGTRGITRTGMRVGGEESLRWWADRFSHFDVSHRGIVERDGRLTLDFEDPEGQRLSLIDENTDAAFNPWEKSSVPVEHQIRGLGPITISVPKLDRTQAVLTKLLGMREGREYRASSADGPITHVFEMGEGGPSAELHVTVEPNIPAAQQGAGGVHHVAFRIPDSEYDAWTARLGEGYLPQSGPVDRFYFRSLYFREPNGVLFEIATDGPGFTADEPLERLGEGLSLPPFLEGRRQEIEAGLKPL